MSSSTVITIIFVILACCFSLGPTAPTDFDDEGLEQQHLEYQPFSHPQYRYAYRVTDPEHGNYQEKYESRDGEKVHGFYSLVEPDGNIRVVRYTADETGFHAHVSRPASINDVAKHVNNL
ncbi:cuticle protein 18.6-like [Ischnura elegans]|uniref:cuticle protein 18.6-like n=1 Tax=Ischnura elegans TaxID=197161 RepID=UPI001ED88084|nr:cuticle protein 18.6-like [Ischnura elegans]